jgi:hypothetical protein
MALRKFVQLDALLLAQTKLVALLAHQHQRRTSSRLIPCQLTTAMTILMSRRS